MKANKSSAYALHSLMYMVGHRTQPPATIPTAAKAPGEIDRLELFESIEAELDDLCRARDFGDEKSRQYLAETSLLCQFAGVCHYGFEMRFHRSTLRLYSKTS
jgi:hypothetical protein